MASSSNTHNMHSAPAKSFQSWVAKTKICFMCCSEIRNQIHLHSKFSSEQECTFVLSHILEVPQLKTYLERVKFQKVSFCKHCLEKISKVRELLEELEKLEKMLLDEKYEIELQFRRNCEMFNVKHVQAQAGRLSPTDQIKNDILTDIRSSAILSILEKLQSKQVGKRAKPRDSVRTRSFRNISISSRRTVLQSAAVQMASRPLIQGDSRSLQNRRLSNQGFSEHRNLQSKSQFSASDDLHFEFPTSNSSLKERSGIDPLSSTSTSGSGKEDTDLQNQNEGDCGSILPDLLMEEGITPDIHIQEEDGLPFLRIGTAHLEFASESEDAQVDNSLEQISHDDDNDGDDSFIDSSCTAFYSDSDNNMESEYPLGSIIANIPSESISVEPILEPTNVHNHNKWYQQHQIYNPGSGTSSSLQSILEDVDVKPIIEEEEEGVQIFHKKTRPPRNSRGYTPYVELLIQAIQSSPDKRLMLGQIYEWMIANVPDKVDSTSTVWKNTIRHNLSLHECFVRVRDGGPGKSSYWMVNPDVNSKDRKPKMIKNVQQY